MKKPSKGYLWIVFAVLFAFVSITKTTSLLPGLALVFFLAYYAALLVRESVQERRFAWKRGVVVGVLLLFAMATRMGKAVLNETTRPLVLASLERRVRKNPDDTLTIQHLSTVYSAMGRHHKAMPHIEALLARDSCNVVALSNRALLGQLSMQFEQSLADCRKAVECANSLPILWNQLGIAFENVGKADSARTAYGKALSLLKPEDELFSAIEKRMAAADSVAAISSQN